VVLRIERDLHVVAGVNLFCPPLSGLVNEISVTPPDAEEEI
jgi:hypothetical protein